MGASIMSGVVTCQMWIQQSKFSFQTLRWKGIPSNHSVEFVALSSPPKTYMHVGILPPRSLLVDTLCSAVCKVFRLHLILSICDIIFKETAK
jgi:hypothetical protein